MIQANYQGVIIPYRDHVGKHIHEIEEQIPLDQYEDTLVEPVDNDTTIQFNSTYVEVLDKAYNWRGEVNFFAVGLLGLGFFMMGLMVAIALSVLDIISVFAIILALGFCGLLFILYKNLLKKDLFGYTYYPIRFNRRNRKIYVFKTKDDIREYSWDELKIAVTKVHTGDIRKKEYDIRFNQVDKNGVIIDAFCMHCLLQTSMEKYEKDGKYYFNNFEIEGVNLISNWEYIRHYMQEDIAKSHKVVRGLIPLDKKRESLWQMIKVSWFFSPKIYDYTEYENPQGISYKIDYQKTYNNSWLVTLFRGLCFFLVLMSFIGRLFVMHIAKRPVWPAWVEEACQVDKNDPYNYEKHPNGGHPKAQPSLWGRIVIVLTIGLCYASVYILLWLFDTIASMKGNDLPTRFSDYLAFWQWF